MQIYPSKDFLKKLAKEYKLVPLVLEIEYPIDPVAAFERVRSEAEPPRRGLRQRSGESFLLQSGKPDIKTGRYSFLGVSPFLVFKSRGNEVEVIRGKHGSKKYPADPIIELKKLLKEFSSPRIEGMPPFAGGAVGYLSYDAKGLFEKLPENAYDDLGLPDIYLIFVDTVVVFDHFEGKAKVICNVESDDFENSYERASDKLAGIAKMLKPLCDKKPWPVKRSQGRQKAKHRRARRGDCHIASDISKAHFEEMVCAAKRYIKKGDIYQANLSQRFSSPLGIEPLELYKLLMKINPSPFASFLDFDGFCIASSSPERLLKRSGRIIETRPIAGTKPRGTTNRLDNDLSRRLLLSPKERAEHIMLVDLERNDLGRVCEYGSVHVDELMTLERYSHVTHIVSNISGILKRGKDNMDIIRACFPGGTITGTPKIRSMEIIDELEPVARGIYTGSIGYLGFNGEMDLNIVIRTFLIKNKRAYVQAGAGIVADSNPAREYSETRHKVEALFEAIAMCRS